MGFTGTTAQYNTAKSAGLIKDGMKVNITDDYGSALMALGVGYDNTTSSISSTSVQGAIDEVNENLTKLREIKIATTSNVTSDATGNVILTSAQNVEVLYCRITSAVSNIAYPFYYPLTASWYAKIMNTNGASVSGVSVNVEWGYIEK